MAKDKHLISSVIRINKTEKDFHLPFHTQSTILLAISIPINADHGYFRTKALIFERL